MYLLTEELEVLHKYIKKQLDVSTDTDIRNELSPLEIKLDKEIKRRYNGR